MIGSSSRSGRGTSRLEGPRPKEPDQLTQMKHRTPDFLIIGAMKAGTTSLYQDLLTQPVIFMPSEKEPNSLVRDDALTPRGRRAYAALFNPAQPGQLCGEASTDYTKLPRFTGVPRRAREVCGGNLKLVYLVREPIARMRSHHHHCLTSGIFSTPSIDEAIRVYGDLIDWSRYAMQARAWIEEFGRDNLHIIRFETFIKARRKSIAELCAFLGFDADVSKIDEAAVFNPSEGKHILTGRRSALRRTALYQRMIRPLVGEGVREQVKRLVGRKAPPRPGPPSRETVQFVVDSLRDDLEDLRGLMGLEGPVWDMDEVIAKHTP